jgi:hypothetical protein
MILDEGVMRFLKNQFSLLIIASEKDFNKVKLAVFDLYLLLRTGEFGFFS